MKHIDEFRDPKRVAELTSAIAARATRPWTLMEICGGQTQAILKYGLDSLLPKNIELLHGPGCPVCVTPAHVLDLALDLARRPQLTLCTYGDMLRVPASDGRSLLQEKGAGADVRVLYSPLDALQIARAEPSREVVFLAVGFETTAPAHAMAVLQAEAAELSNFSLLVSHVLVPPAMAGILSQAQNRVQAFLAAGHVCTVMGYQEYETLARAHRVPIVVTGFEPVDLLEGIFLAVRQLESGEYRVENQYVRSVSREGNRAARLAMEKVFRKSDGDWRGLGTLPESGLVLRPAYLHRDAAKRLALRPPPKHEGTRGRCLSGRVLTGEIKPPQCPEFGGACTPDHPLGATMVSGEGACAAYFQYRSEHPRTERPESQ